MEMDAVASGEGTLVEDGGKVGGVINVEMREEDDIHTFEIEAEFTEFNESSGTGVDEDARSAVHKNDVAGRAAAEGARAARAEDDEFEMGLVRAVSGMRLLSATALRG